MSLPKVFYNETASDAVSVKKLNPSYDITVDVSKNTSWSTNTALDQTYLESIGQRPGNLNPL